MKAYELGACYMMLNNQLKQEFLTKIQLVIQKKVISTASTIKDVLVFVEHY
jgi:hypothetical protein